MTPGSTRRTIAVNEAVLEKNKALASANRARFDSWNCFAVNLLSSPGAGKTSLLERTISDMAGRTEMAVVVGDLATDNDARRLDHRGAQVVQLTTGDICHLDATMVAMACESLRDQHPNLLFIENVGNMVCPAAFELGEHARAVLLSVTEGEDKPLKYPTIFRTADLVLVTKIDLADAVGFDRAAAMASIAAASPEVRVIEVSARSGSGLAEWYDWLLSRIPKGHLDGDAER